MNYHDVNGAFPPTAEDTLARRLRHEVADARLPGADALFNAINFDLSWNSSAGAPNSTVYRTTINTFLCPSDGNFPNFQRATASIGGPEQLRQQHRHLPLVQRRHPRRPRLLRGHEQVRAGRDAGLITDGTSNTAIWSEYIKGKGTSTTAPASSRSPGKWVVYLMQSITDSPIRPRSRR